MIFSMYQRVIFFLLFVLAATLGRFNDKTAAETPVEASESIHLYEKIGARERVPVVTCIDLERSGKLLAIGGDDHRVRLWDINVKGIILTLQEHLDWVRGLAFSSDQSRLATIGQDGQIKLWSVQDGSLIRSLKEPVRGTQKIVFQPNGTGFAVCGFDENVRIYDTATGNLSATLPTHGGNNKAITYSPDGSLLAAAGRTGVVRIWRTSDNVQLADIRTDGRRINALAFSPDGSTIASAGDGPFISLVRIDGSQARALPERPGKTYSLVFCGPNMLASGESDSVVRLWDINNSCQISTFLGHTGTISTMVFEQASGRLITGSFDTTVRFWNIPADTTSTPLSLEASVPTTSTQTSPFANPAALSTPALPVAF